jgi:nitronate monooxygenase
VQDAPWPKAFAGRALKNAFTDRFHDREDAIDEAARAEFAAAKASGDFRVADVYAGEAVGLRDRVQPAGEILRDLSEGAEDLLRARLSSLLG